MLIKERLRQIHDKERKRARKISYMLPLIVVLLAIAACLFMRLRAELVNRQSKQFLNTCSLDPTRISDQQISLPGGVSAKVESFRLFSAMTTPDTNKTQDYGRRFKQKTARVVCLELSMVFTKPTSGVLVVPMECEYRDSRGDVVTGTAEWTVQANGISYTGYFYRGNMFAGWKTDKYTVVVKLNGCEAVRDQFVVN